VTASGNGAGGSGYGVTLVNNSALSPQPVKITGSGLYESNLSGGLNVTSLGAITVASLTVRDTLGGNGVQLYNNSLGAAGAVTLSGTTLIENNSGSGLYAYSRGAIAIKTKVFESSGNGWAAAGMAFSSTTPMPKAR